MAGSSILSAMNSVQKGTSLWATLVRCNAQSTWKMDQENALGGRTLDPHMELLFQVPCETSNSGSASSLMVQGTAKYLSFRWFPSADPGTLLISSLATWFK